MSAQEFARLVRARKVGRGKWIAKCPAHPDKHPSLSIGEGKRAAIVFKCMSHGCTANEILRAMGLKWRDILGESGMDREMIRQLEAERERQRAREQSFKEYRTFLSWKALDKIQFWHRKSQVLGRSLAKWPEQDKLAKQFHHALDMERRARKVWESL